MELTRVGPGTLMGEMMRQYWVPAAASGELSADSDPIRLVLLGERLIAFRDSDGVVGVMDHRCPHRCASLFLGRNEQGGIRCVYHGWKFSTDGTCVDMPNVAPEDRFAVKAKAYPAAERNGLIWVYLGSRAEPPPLPQVEANLLSAVTIQFVQRDCNWLQAMEGDIDTSHFGFLHAGHITQDMLEPDSGLYHTVGNRAPKYHVTDTPWGINKLECSISGMFFRHDHKQANFQEILTIPINKTLRVGGVNPQSEVPRYCRDIFHVA